MEIKSFRWTAFSDFKDWLFEYFESFVESDNPQSQKSKFFLDLVDRIQHAQTYEELEEVVNGGGFSCMLFAARWLRSNSNWLEGIKSTVERHVKEENVGVDEEALNKLRSATSWHEVAIAISAWADPYEYIKYVILPKWFTGD
jgi:hypothetical protein